MSNSSKTRPQTFMHGGRETGGTEHSWCSAVPCGTGIAVLAIQTTKFIEPNRLEKAIHKLQTSHPILRSRLHSVNKNKHTTFTFLTSPTPFVSIKTFNLSSTLQILKTHSDNETQTPLHSLLEHELNQNAWINQTSIIDMFFVNVYTLSESRFFGVFRLHVSACDRTTAVSLLKELLELLCGDDEVEIGNEGEKINLGIENLIPDGKAKKSMWSHGVDMINYSVNSFRLTNLKFEDTRLPRSSQVVRLQLNKNDTLRIISGCKSRGIKLCGAVAAASLIAAGKGYSKSNGKRRYAVATLTDCRALVKPSLNPHNFGNYHSVILNTHELKGGEKLWELATTSYNAFQKSKNSNRHFTDMADLNLLMCKAIDNPGLTPSSSLRTSLVSVFEDTVIDDSNETQQTKIGLVDYMGCASVHGIGPSVAIFDTIRDGMLDCVCVYPSPLHSRKQMQEFIDNVKSILLGA